MAPKPATVKKTAAPAAAKGKLVRTKEDHAKIAKSKAMALVLNKRRAGTKKRNLSHLKSLRINPVTRSKNEIRVIKREGGTMRYAKALKSIRKAKKAHALRQQKAVLTAQKKEAIKKIKTDLDNKKASNKKFVKVQIKKPKEYQVVKMRRSYHTQLPMRKLPSKNTFKDQHPENHRHRAYLRKSLVPGTVCILLAGRHQCKKVVFLKQLRRSGLCLVTGPWSLNRVPLRRMDQRFMIATSVRVELPKSFKVPTHIDDSYFKKPRVIKKKVSKADDDIFKTKKVTLKQKPNLGRQNDQRYVDKAIRSGIRRHVDAASIKKYLKRDFGLQGRRYAHKLNF